MGTDVGVTVISEQYFRIVICILYERRSISTPVLIMSISTGYVLL